ncbi:MAG TPA: hypothetical protein VKZ49_16260, partial [Polyangiaceae bacterium]|nr:hypothetical protein [Polyangiaceae bacterium]
VPALKGMRSEEIAAARRQLRQLDAKGAPSIAATRQLSTQVDQRQAEIEEAAGLPPDRQLEVLSRPLPLELVRPLTPPSQD